MDRNSKVITYKELVQMLNSSADIILVDVRSMQEYSEEHLPGSINIPVYELNQYADYILTDKDRMIVVYCQNNGRSIEALEILESKGYNNVYQLDGGLDSI